ncbi:MAG: hypothetical protein VXW65_14510 [Pseudomonadota bacterium]|nr:hypothetical protein [Pseudomonadota bacterium]
MQLQDYFKEFTAWDALSERQRSFFYGDDYLPLPASHAARISRLHGIRAVEFIRLALYQMPNNTSFALTDFKHEQVMLLEGVWGDQARITAVRDWLYQTGMPFSTQVFLLRHEEVIATDWKTLVRYWDAFAWSVGVDQTKSWLCAFHHEQVMTFMRY